jgi:hypothetical protein
MTPCAAPFLLQVKRVKRLQRACWRDLPKTERQRYVAFWHKADIAIEAANVR